MTSSTTRAMLATVALAMTLGLAACGSDTPQPTAQEKWASSLCKNLTATTEGLQAPSTDGVPEDEVKAVIVDFLTEMQTRLDTQQQVLADAGAPPEAKAEAYDKAKASLDQASKTLDRITMRFSDSTGKSAEQRQAAMLELSESLTDPATYQGPLVELMNNDEGLRTTIEKTSQCDAILAP